MQQHCQAAAVSCLHAWRCMHCCRHVARSCMCARETERVEEAMLLCIAHPPLCRPHAGGGRPRLQPALGLPQPRRAQRQEPVHEADREVRRRVHQQASSPASRLLLLRQIPRGAFWYSTKTVAASVCRVSNFHRYTPFAYFRWAHMARIPRSTEVQASGCTPCLDAGLLHAPAQLPDVCHRVQSHVVKPGMRMLRLGTLAPQQRRHRTFCL